MKYFDSPLSKEDVDGIHKTYGEYVKITADLKNKSIVVGCELHADGEKILLEKGGTDDYIWGGGIDFIIKEITTTAMLNLRPRLNNNSMEILDFKRRSDFIELVRNYLIELWQ